MNDADFAVLGGTKGRCAFRLTRVAYPSLLYGNSNATIKLNGKLITLPLAAAGTYRDGPLGLKVSPRIQPHVRRTSTRYEWSSIHKAPARSADTLAMRHVALPYSPSLQDDRVESSLDVA